MRQAEIYRKEVLAGILTEDGGEYRFCYDEAYLTREDALPVSLTLPLQTEAFVSPVLFPFFDGLIPEGWLLDVALRNTLTLILQTAFMFSPPLSTFQNPYQHQLQFLCVLF